MERDESLKTGGGSDPAAGFASVTGSASPAGLGGGREFDLIRRFYRDAPPRARADVRVGAGDDCAVVTGDGIVLSVDLSVEDVHFRRDWLPPFDIGFRAATASLSDLAAMAARPIGVLVSLAAHENDADEYVVELMRGVTSAAAAAGGVLLGGDLTRSSGALVVDVVAVGQASAPVTRGGARPGDELWVTGVLGGSGAAVEALLQGANADAAAMERFRRPVARIREAQWLAQRGVVTAMLDLSDGLGGDAGHMAAASGVAIVVETKLLPIHPAATSAGAAHALKLALSGGEDYELCFTSPAGSLAELRQAFVATFGIELTRVGRVEEGEGLTLIGEGGEMMRSPGGFQHFRARSQ